MKIGDKIRVVKCDVCPKVVGKTGKITKIILSETQTEEKDVIMIKFGRGRPQLNRPDVYSYDSVVLIEE